MELRTAKAMRELAESKKTKLDKILEEILEMAEQGDFELRINDISQQDRNELTKLGYTVKALDQPVDQDYTTHVIEW